MIRRTFLSGIAGGAALSASPAAADSNSAPVDARKGRVKQGVTGGVFGRKGMTFEQQCEAASKLGVTGYDLKGPEDFATIKKYGMLPTMVPGGSGIRDGINETRLHADIDKRMRKAIDDAAAAGAPNVIVLSGERKGMPDDVGLANCVTFLNNIKGYAEEKKVTLCLELLNSKVNHPDYQCDRTWWGVEVCRRVGSPRVKLLFDIYHMQIMEGDVIRTIRNNIQWIGHFHTAGNPGRHEMDDTQESNYRGIANAIADLKFEGWLSHEYSPLKDPLTSLADTIRMCTV